MNRTDRLFAITVLLQARARVRAVDLAEHFGVSIRTIYRDIVALSESGIPIAALPGEGYALMEGFTLPPLAFSEAEAAALALATSLLASHAGGRLPADAELAHAKIAAVLPAATRERVERLRATLAFVAPTRPLDLDDQRLVLLRQAIEERRVVRLRYHAWARATAATRDVEPETLAWSAGAWYLGGWCRLRAAERSFRLDRIERLELLDATWRPRDRVASAPPAERITAQVRVDAASVRWLREWQHWGFVADAPAPDGSGDVVMTYAVDALDELVPWLLGWGPRVLPLSPPELVARIRDEARRMLARLAE